MVSKHFEKIKSWVGDNKSDILIAATIFLVGLASFGLGRLSAIWPQKEPITITDGPPMSDIKKDPILTGSAATPSAAKGKYVASKSGTAYHYPWCAGAQKIKEGNKIWFDTKEAAEKAGYKPAGNCEGL